MQRPHITTGTSIFVFLTCALAVSAQDTARTVQYHAQDIIPIRAKVKFTTLTQTIPTYLKDSGLPYVTIVVKNVILDDLKMSPYSARIEFERVREPRAAGKGLRASKPPVSVARKA